MSTLERVAGARRKSDCGCGGCGGGGERETAGGRWVRRGDRIVVVLGSGRSPGIGELEREIVPPGDSRTRISDTTRIPYRFICSVIPTFRHPTTGKDLEMSDQSSTGFLIGPRHILTAAHVLFPVGGALADQSPVRVKVTPGHNDRAKQYGEFVSTVYKVRSEWRSGGKNRGDARYDFAVIEVSSKIREKGLKCWGSPGTNTERFPLSKTWLKGKRVNVCGYPRDKKRHTLWIAHDVLDDPEPTRNGQPMANLFRYKADTCVGQSGSPVWWYDGKSKRYLVGIHTGFCDFLDGCSRKSGPGCVPGSSPWSHNRGVLFSHEVKKQIDAWLK